MAASPSFIVGILGNVISLLVFASPIKTFVGVVRKKSTGNYSGTPYVTSLLATSLWTFYGLMKPDGLLVYTINGAGVVVELVYVSLFTFYATKDKKATMIKVVALANVCSLGLVIGITLLALHGSIRLTFVGILCATLNVVMYASPLAVVRTVILTKSVEYMPFLLSFFLLLNAGVWSTYSILVKDIYMCVPNVIGLGLGLAQLILYMVYKSKSDSRKSIEIIEEGLMKDRIEMHASNIDSKEDDGNGDKKRNQSGLHKGGSLPMPFIKRQYSMQKMMMRAISSGP